MPNIISRAGGELNAAFQIGDFQNVTGMILESWGPSTRNADYNDALEIIIERLQGMAVGEIGVNVISRELVDLLPNFPDRAIAFDASAAVNLRGRSPRDIRLEIGRSQARLKSDPSKQGGNRTKRILLHSAHLASSDWSRVASPTALRSLDGLPQVVPDAPSGTESPKTYTQVTLVIERDSSVRAWILRNAAGICELCRKPAPFLGSDGLPFLEVHHVIPLAEDGPDTIANAVALCPNCHRELHLGADRFSKIQQLYDQSLRLVGASSKARGEH